MKRAQNNFDSGCCTHNSDGTRRPALIKCKPSGEGLKNPVRIASKCKGKKITQERRLKQWDFIRVKNTKEKGLKIFQTFLQERSNKEFTTV